jgi:hypothetical protein
VGGLKRRLGPYGLGESLALCSRAEDAPPPGAADGCTDLAEAGEADLLVSLSYGACAGVVGRFRRSALVDIDPGLLQVWLSEGLVHLGRYGVYFTIGETVGRPGARFPAGGID